METDLMILGVLAVYADSLHQIILITHTTLAAPQSEAPLTKFRTLGTLFSLLKITQ